MTDDSAFDDIDRRTRGLLLGRHINLKPPPPAKDLLAGPLLVRRLPRIDLPNQSLKDRLSAFLFRTVLGYREAEYRAIWDLRQAVAAVMASVSPTAAQKLEDLGWSLERRVQGGQRVVAMTHPDQFQEAMLLLIAAPEALSRDARFLEVVFAVVLRHYLKEISAAAGNPFSFNTEAHSHCMQAYDLERQIKNVVDTNERIMVLQNIYDRYHYTSQYYLYSLLSRESAPDDGKMFSMYVRAVFFISRLQYDGTLLEQVNRRRLPARREVMFRIKRDRALQRRYTDDPEFAAQIKMILNVFPTT
ncbi:MAG: hypothetical protein WCO00_15485 [Rhodospirillaceae bacterium]